MEPQEKNNGVFIVIIFLLIAAFFLFYKMTRMESENATISKQIGYGRPNTEIEKIEREIEERQNKLRELQIKKELIQKKIRREEMSIQTKNQERVKTVKTNNTLVTRIISFDIETRKAVFNEMITSYQKAFVPQGTELPNDIFEKLSKTLPEGASSISIKKFITMYYKNKPQEEKYTILNPYNSSKNSNGFNEVRKDFFKTAIEKALKQDLINNKNYILCCCEGMVQAEFEDSINLEIYRQVIIDEYGVDLNTGKMRNRTKIWSNRLKEIFEENGKLWNKEVENKVKYLVADCVSRQADVAVDDNKCKSVNNLIKLLESRL
mgnify:CR=1 FL=1